ARSPAGGDVGPGAPPGPQRRSARGTMDPLTLRGHRAAGPRGPWGVRVFEGGGSPPRLRLARSRGPVRRDRQGDPVGGERGGRPASLPERPPLRGRTLAPPSAPVRAARDRGALARPAPRGRDARDGPLAPPRRARERPRSRARDGGRPRGPPVVPEPSVGEPPPCDRAPAGLGQALE